MTQAEVQRLYPPDGARRPIAGLYLDQDLRHRLDLGPVVYTAFITSLDGRIAVEADDGGWTIPDLLANDRDWRLFQELATQADVLITTGRYFRNLERRDDQPAVLSWFDEPGFGDLRRWREHRGLPAHPDLAVVSPNLDLRLPRGLTDQRRVLVLGAEAADKNRVEALEEQGARVLRDDRALAGAGLVQALVAAGWRAIFSTAGPTVLQGLLEDGVLDRLYLTLAQRLMGDVAALGLLGGFRLSAEPRLRLCDLYLDSEAPAGAGQLLGTWAVEKGVGEPRSK